MRIRWCPVPIVGLETHYAVSNTGQVKRLTRGGRRYPVGYVLSPRDNGKGYLFVELQAPNVRPRVVYIHALVASTFIGERPADREVHHRNENKADNRAANLRYLTHPANMRASATKMTPRKVRRVRRRVLAGEARATVGVAFGISRQHVDAIVSGRRWGG